MVCSNPRYFHLRLTTIRHSAARFRGLRIYGLSTWVPLRSTPGFMLSPAPQARFILANSRNTTLVTDYQWSLGGSRLSNNLDLFVNGFIKGRLSLEAQTAGAKTHDSFVVDQNVSGKFINSEGPLHLAVAIPEL